MVYGGWLDSRVDEVGAICPPLVLAPFFLCGASLLSTGVVMVVVLLVVVVVLTVVVGQRVFEAKTGAQCQAVGHGWMYGCEERASHSPTFCVWCVVFSITRQFPGWFPDNVVIVWVIFFKRAELNFYGSCYAAAAGSALVREACIGTAADFSGYRSYHQLCLQTLWGGVSSHLGIDKHTGASVACFRSRFEGANSI